ncbi:xylulokinase [Paramicrobacterium humi]|uniref:Xylulokinase n=1 Tax=Paramicrobacterium humi TaxID=640635 RepID=A0A1H4L8T8_9MICO|nr:FGGY family carbohydrate kinase [Microbacterium humi]SEB67131.1 xylulokinase [Microbacterium humi]
MAHVWIGIDLGTSSVKCVALDERASVIATSQERYPVNRPRPGWAEQDPESWWLAVVAALAGLLHRLPAGTSVGGAGLSGQMHGLVLVDNALRPVRPAIIWSDSRASREVEYWRARVGDNEIEAKTGFRPASGMAGVSLSWVRAHEPEAFARAAFAMQPKDYVRLRLTGRAGLDPTDAGASLLFDVRSGVPAQPLLDIAGVGRDLLPQVVATLAPFGTVTQAAARETGLAPGVLVATGGSDQAMAAFGLGLDSSDRAAISLSSGGTVLVPIDSSAAVPPGYHRLAAATPRHNLAMGVILAAGLATEWLASMLNRSVQELLEAAADVSVDDALIGLSDFGGTRTPRVDGAPQGAFSGIGFHHEPAHLMRALVEGAAVSLAGALADIQPGTLKAKTVVLSGGGARFAVWRQSVADATGLPVTISADLEHSALGAALSAAAAAEADVTFDAAQRVHGIVQPSEESVARLRRQSERRAALAEVSSTRRHPQNYGSGDPK